MRLINHRKLAIILLIIYWPLLFILLRIPIPLIVYRAGISDKSLHFLAYLILVFLLSFAATSQKKLNLRKRLIWLLLLGLTAYAFLDEATQPLVNRNYDLADFMANLAGLFIGLILVCCFSFWPASLIVTAISIFLLTNISRTNPADLVPLASSIFYLASYSLVTLLWIVNINQLSKIKPPSPQWLIIALAIPSALILISELYAHFFSSGFTPSRLILSVISITITTSAAYLTRLHTTSQ